MKNIFPIRVNDRVFDFDEPKITGKQLLELVGLTHSVDYEILLKHNQKELEPVQLDEVVDLTHPDIETFHIKPYPSVTIDVDDETYPIAHIFMTPKEIMVLAGVDSTKFYLKQLLEAKEITYKSDAEHIIAMHHKMRFVTCKLGSATVS